MLRPRMDPWGTPQWTVTFWKCIEMNQWQAFWQIWSQLISAAFGTDCHNVLLGRMFLPFRSKRATTDRRPASDAIPRLLLTVCCAASLSCAVPPQAWGKHLGSLNQTRSTSSCIAHLSSFLQPSLAWGQRKFMMPQTCDCWVDKVDKLMYAKMMLDGFIW